MFEFHTIAYNLENFMTIQHFHCEESSFRWWSVSVLSTGNNFFCEQAVVTATESPLLRGDPSHNPSSSCQNKRGEQGKPPLSSQSIRNRVQTYLKCLWRSWR